MKFSYYGLHCQFCVAWLPKRIAPNLWIPGYEILMVFPHDRVQLGNIACELNKSSIDACVVCAILSALVGSAISERDLSQI
jgi:hypothetical protein